MSFVPNSRFHDQHTQWAVQALADEAYTVADGDGVLLCTQSAAADHTITLPPVAGNAGRFLYIELVSMAGGNDYIVADAGDDAQFTNLTLDTAGDRALLLCTGRAWCAIFTEIT